MERIIRQEIAEKVINESGYEWAPYSNKVTKDGEAADAPAEPDTRYSHIISVFNALKATDPYNPGMNTAMLRSFSRRDGNLPRRMLQPCSGSISAHLSSGRWQRL